MLCSARKGDFLHGAELMKQSLSGAKSKWERAGARRGELCSYARLGEAKPCAVKDLPHPRQDLLAQENVAIAL